MSNPALDKAVEIIKKFEGCRLTAYRDSVGVLTIGWGCTGPTITSHTTWTQAQADAALLDRVAICLHQAAVASPILTNYPNKLAAITSAVYNLGYGTYINSHHLLPAINAGNWPEAAEYLKEYCHAGGVVVDGLVNRRNAESVLLTQ